LAQNHRSITNMVFIILLAALIVGIGDLTWQMLQAAASGPTA